MLRRERALLASLLGVAIACWLWIVMLARDMYGSMDGPAAWMMTSAWTPTHTFLLWAMWAVMMGAMMLPSASPFVLLYAAALRLKSNERVLVPVVALTAGYLLTWTAFSVGATAVQRAMTERLLLTSMMVAAQPKIAAALLLAAGLYQLTPLKTACLARCQSPLGVLMTRWRPGASGAMRMGLEHGMYCLGCCWALMLLLFAFGVMNLTWIVALTVVVLLEKVSGAGHVIARASGVAATAAGVWILARG